MKHRYENEQNINKITNYIILMKDKNILISNPFLYNIYNFYIFITI